jgi:alpha-beta hydrolase superfamily lysophospholipase
MNSEAVKFVSKGVSCHGVLCSPSKAVSNGAGVVIAHGFCGTVDSGLVAYAEAFAEAGFHALAFDYRGFGLSEGKKRQYISVPDQIEDWRHAIGFLHRHELVDAERIGLWGISFAGGHVLHLAHDDARIRAVVAQVPLIDPVLAFNVGAYQRGEQASAALEAQAVKHLKRRWFSRKVDMIKVAPDERPGPAMLGAKEASVYAKIAGPSWRNELHPDSLLFGKIANNNPSLLTDDLTTPMLVQMGTRDKTVSNEAIVNFARRCGPLAQFTTYDADHFTMLQATPQRTGAIGEAVAFYQNHLIL